jgi:cell wall-associated NlpC family hydrolase
MAKRLALAVALWLWAAPVVSAPGSLPALQPVVQQYRDSLPKGYGPAAVLDVQATWQSGRIVLSGRTLGAAEREALHRRFAALGAVEDRIEIFPYLEVGERSYGAVRVPVTDLRARPDAASGLESQLLLGDTVRVIALGTDRQWLKILRDWDGYVGWVEAHHLATWTSREYESWRARPKWMLLRPEQGLPRAAVLAAETPSSPAAPGEAQIAVSTPDGRTLRLPPKAVRPLQQTAVPTRDQIVRYARALLADQPTRYLWGGTAGNALDCSGFNQTVFRLAGLALPRDSYQQQAASRPVAATLADWQQLQPGDLVFFSEDGRRATHTGIYIGGGKFIHSSRGNDGIALNDLRGDSTYEQILRRLWWGAGRVLP